MDVLDRHLDVLKGTHNAAQMLRRPDGSALVSVSGIRLPAGWNATTTTVYFVAPVGYPAARPDCFWTSQSLRLASGTLPTNAQVNANYGGPEPLLWFSYHLTSRNPIADNFLTYLNVAQARLREAR